MAKQDKINRHKKSSTRKISSDAGTAGVVGMGLMGTSITACLLASGYQVCCVEIDPAKLRTARRRLLRVLKEAERQGLLKHSSSLLIDRVTVSSDFIVLEKASIIVEATVEDLKIKQAVIKEIESVVSPKALIGSNTSAIPVTNLQSGSMRPERILGLHWAEPANVTPFMEIICGKHTSLVNARRVEKLAKGWGKEPSLLRRDIRGFIANRILYAMLREAFHLVDSGYATVEDVDRSMRNDLGYWITLAGPFRFMDLMGIPAYASVMKELLPDLSCAAEIPPLMRKVIRTGARGVSNEKGFYSYTPAQAKQWEKLFMEFSYEIRELAQKYPEDIGDRATRRRKV